MVIRMRHTRAHTKNRRSHHALSSPVLVDCLECNAKRQPHHACLDCGFYKGRKVIDLAVKKEARLARLKAKKEVRQPPDAEPVSDNKESPAN